MSIALNSGEIVGRLGVSVDQVNLASTGFEVAYTQRRHGVETRLVSRQNLPQRLRANLLRSGAQLRVSVVQAAPQQRRTS